MGIDINSAPDSFKRRLPAKERAKFRAYWTQEDAEKRYAAGQEKALQDDIETWLRSQSIYYTRARMDKRTTTRKGTPDFECCVERRYLAIEVKTGTNPLSAEQESEKLFITRNKGVYLVAYDLKSVISIVRHLQAEMRFVDEILKRNGYKWKD